MAYIGAKMQMKSREDDLAFTERKEAAAGEFQQELSDEWSRDQSQIDSDSDKLEEIQEIIKGKLVTKFTRRKNRR